GIKSDNYTKREINNLRNKGAIYITGNENEDGYCNTLDPIKSLNNKGKLDQTKYSHLKIKEKLLKDIEKLSTNLENSSPEEIKIQIKELISDLGSLSAF
ncbi:hypothetical protein, partial [Acinetobacter sp. YH16053]